MKEIQILAGLNLVVSCFIIVALIGFWLTINRVARILRQMLEDLREIWKQVDAVYHRSLDQDNLSREIRLTKNTAAETLGNLAGLFGKIEEMQRQVYALHQRYGK